MSIIMRTDDIKYLKDLPNMIYWLDQLKQTIYLLSQNCYLPCFPAGLTAGLSMIHKALRSWEVEIQEIKEEIKELKLDFFREI